MQKRWKKEKRLRQMPQKFFEKKENAFDCTGADKRLVRKKHDENGWNSFDIVRM